MIAPLPPRRARRRHSVLRGGPVDRADRRGAAHPHGHREVGAGEGPQPARGDVGRRGRRAGRERRDTMTDLDHHLRTTAHRWFDAATDPLRTEVRSEVDDALGEVLARVAGGRPAVVRAAPVRRWAVAASIVVLVGGGAFVDRDARRRRPTPVGQRHRAHDRRDCDVDDDRTRTRHHRCRHHTARAGRRQPGRRPTRRRDRRRRGDDHRHALGHGAAPVRRRRGGVGVRRRARRHAHDAGRSGRERRARAVRPRHGSGLPPRAVGGAGRCATPGDPARGRVPVVRLAERGTGSVRIGDDRGGGVRAGRSPGPAARAVRREALAPRRRLCDAPDVRAARRRTRRHRSRSVDR